MTAVVRTVLGDVPASRLDVTLGHEHLIARPPAQVVDVDLHLIPATVARMQRAGGFDESDLSRLLVENPRNWLAFTPP